MSLGESFLTVRGDAVMMAGLRIQKTRRLQRPSAHRRGFTPKIRQKRMLQIGFLSTVALIFLPNVGLWSLYKEKQQLKSPETVEQVRC